MDAKAVALKLRKLASDPDNQTYIVKEKGCMKGLLNFLESKDEQVQLISLQALQFLSSHPLNQETLAKEPGLLPKLVGLVDHDNADVKKVAQAVLDNLESVINGDKNKKAKDETVAFAPQYLYTIRMYVADMRGEAAEATVEKALLTVKGVVSITLESGQRLAVYSRTPEKEIACFLVAAVAAVGYNASLLVPSSIPPVQQPSTPAAPANAAPAPASVTKERENSISTPLKRPVLKENSAVKSNTPAYHTNVSTPIQPKYVAGPSALSAAAVKGRSTALTEYSGTPQTLSAFKKDKEKEQAKDQQQKGAIKSLFGAVTSYFW